MPDAAGLSGSIMVERTFSIDPERLLAHTEWVRRLTRRLVLDAAGADDVAQETLLHALEREGAPVRHPRAWLATVARSLARRLRRAQERRADHEARAPAPRGERAAAEVVARASLHRAVVEAVLALAEPYRSTILVRFFEDVDARAVAQRLDVPLETVRTRLKRGLALLRERLERSNDGRDWALLAAPLGTAGTIATAAKLVAAAALVAALAIGAWRFTRSDDRPAAGRELARATDSNANASATQEASAPERTPAPAVDSAAVAPERTPEPVAASAATIRGTVKDDHGEPVAGAFVFVEDADGPPWTGFHDAISFAQVACTRTQRPDDAGPQAWSSGGGGFVVDLPAFGRWSVGVVHPTAGFAWRSGVRVSGAAPDARVDLDLRPGVVVDGDVTDDEGAPIPDARLEFVIKDGFGTITLGRMVTDRDGHYATPSLPVRDLQFWTVRHPGYHSAPRCDVPIRPEEREHRLDFRLARAPILRGRLLDPRGGPADLARPSLAGLQVRACSADADGRPTFSHMDGALGEIDRAHATYELTPDSAGMAFVAAIVGNCMLASEPIAPDREPIDLVLDTSRIEALAGPIEPSRHVARLAVVAKDATTGKAITDYMVTWNDSIGNSTGRCCVAPDGVYRLGEVADGACVIRLEKRRYASATRKVEVGADAPGEPPLELFLEPMAGELAGRVATASAGPIEGAHLLALDESGAPLVAFPDCEEWSDSHGEFELASLPSTPCLLLVEDDAHAPRVVRCRPSSRPPPLEIALEPGVRVDLLPRDADGNAVDLGQKWNLRVTDEAGLLVVDTRLACRRSPPIRDGAIELRIASGHCHAELAVAGWRPVGTSFDAIEGAAVPIELVKELDRASESR